jgi:hypothetical protein
MRSGPTVVAAVGLACIAVACVEGQGAPLGRGDLLKTDVDASLGSSAPAPPVDASAPDDSPFAPLDGPYGRLADGYAPLAVCAACACANGTYCFGGSQSSALTSCDQGATAGSGVGCHTIPPACENEPDCVCLLRQLDPQISAAIRAQPSCYPVCASAPSGGFTVYCPP